MKKKRRFPLALSILLPTILAIVLGLGGIYTGAYFVIQDSSYQAAVTNDNTDLHTLQSSFTSDEEENIIGYACSPIVKKYEDNKPDKPFVPVRKRIRRDNPIELLHPALCSLQRTTPTLCHHLRWHFL